MIVYFSTVLRAAPVEQGGELVKLDWTRKQVVARVPVVPRDPPVIDPNPRGNSRGGRGVVLHDQRVTVASYHSLHEFDLDLRPLRTWSHPLFAGLHELAGDNGDTWVTATAIDLALRVSDEGAVQETWWGREDPVLMERFGLSPLSIDKAADNRLRFLTVQANTQHHLHLNAAAMQGGRPLMLLNHYGALIRLHPTEVLVADPTLQGCHNVLPLSSGSILINDTVNRAIREYDQHGAMVRRLDLTIYPLVQRFLRTNWAARTATALSRLLRKAPLLNVLRRRVKSRTVARPVFVRGLCLTPRGTVLAGISPATILEIEWESGRLVDHFVYSQDVRTAVHGLACTSA